MQSAAQVKYENAQTSDLITIEPNIVARHNEHLILASSNLAMPNIQQGILCT
jgi:hypothetical protein